MEPPNKVLGLLNGNRDLDQHIQVWLESSDIVIAADGAGDRALRLGRVPDYVIGDLDSLRSTHANFPQIIPVVDQNFTDCDKLIKFAEAQGWHSLTMIGIEGNRPDHFLASLLSIAKSELDIQIGFECGIGRVIKPGPPLKVNSHSIVSLLPLEPCEGVTLSGVQWPLHEESMSARTLVSISNRGIGEVCIQIKSGLALFFAETEPSCQWEFFQLD